MKPKTESAPPARKPWFSFFCATAGGIGYIPKAPGTWGSLIGAALYWAVSRHLARVALDIHIHDTYYAMSSRGPIAAAIAILLALLGVWTSARMERFAGKKDPQFVVIDEVSGQFFTYLFALAPANWKYLLLGLILFRGFDIWKPFPVRQAESLPGGWGIMADDWLAALYAGIGIWIARSLGL